MGKKRLNLTGQKFGKLLVINKKGRSNSGKVYWNCICDCGNQIAVQAGHLRDGGTKSCKCSRGVRYINDTDACKHDLYKNFCVQAKSRKHKVEISFDKYANLILQPCFYCGLISSNTLKLKHRNISFKYNGLDRVNNNIGYIESNVVACCIYCNRAKRDMTTQEFQDWLQRVHLHYIQPNEQMDYNI